MPRTINLKKVLSTQLVESGLIGGDPKINVEIVFRRGESPEFYEQVRIVIPIEAFLEAQKTVNRHVERHILRAEYLKGLVQ